MDMFEDFFEYLAVELAFLSRQVIFLIGFMEILG